MWTAFSGVARVAVVVILLTTASWGEEGDGTPDGKKSLGGSGHLIQLSIPAGNQPLTGIEIHGARYGTPDPPAEKFLIYVLSSDRSRVLAVEMAPYSLFERGEEKWVAVPFEKGIDFPEGGWIAVDFRPGRTKGIYVSYDAHPGRSSSRTGLPGLEGREVDFGGDWMIRPLTKK